MKSLPRHLTWILASTVTSDVGTKGTGAQGIDTRDLLALIYSSDQFFGFSLPQSCHLRSHKMQESKGNMLEVHI